LADSALGANSRTLAIDSATVLSQPWKEFILFELLSVLTDADAFFHGIFVLLGAFYLAYKFCPQNFSAQLVASAALIINTPFGVLTEKYLKRNDVSQFEPQQLQFASTTYIPQGGLKKRVADIVLQAVCC